MKAILVLSLAGILSLSAFAEEHVERYNIFKTTIEIGIKDSGILLEDFKVQKVPTVVKVTTFDYCYGTESCESFKVLESEEVLQLSFSYQADTPPHSEELSVRYFKINFPLSTISFDEVERLKLLSRGFNTPVKIKNRISFARKFFRDETKEAIGSILEIDGKRSHFCFPEDPYCVEVIKYVSKAIPVKLFSVFLK